MARRKRKSINDMHRRAFGPIIAWLLFNNTLRILYSTYVIRIGDPGNFSGTAKTNQLSNKNVEHTGERVEHILYNSKRALAR